MPGEQTTIIDRAVKQAGKDRRIAFAEQENRMLKWAIGAIILALSGIFVAGGSWYKMQSVAEEVAAMPSPAEHDGVHKLQDQDREYIKETVDDIQAQQTIDKVKIDNTEKNVWKIIVELGLDK